MVGIKLIRPEEINSVWPMVSEFIDNALPKEIILFGIDDVLLSLRDGRWTLAIAHEGDCIDGAVVLGVDNYPKAKAMTIVSLGGREGRKWFDSMSDFIEEFRLLTGSKYTIFMGRDGWSRERPEFRKTASVYYRGEA